MKLELIHLHIQGNYVQSNFYIIIINSVQKFWKTNTAHYLEKPKDLLIDAAKESKNEGSSTLVLVTIEPEEAILHTAYIGGR